MKRPLGSPCVPSAWQPWRRRSPVPSPHSPPRLLPPPSLQQAGRQPRPVRGQLPLPRTLSYGTPSSCVLLPPENDASKPLVLAGILFTRLSWQRLSPALQSRENSRWVWLRAVQRLGSPAPLHGGRADAGGVASTDVSSAAVPPASPGWAALRPIGDELSNQPRHHTKGRESPLAGGGRCVCRPGSSPRPAAKGRPWPWAAPAGRGESPRGGRGRAFPLCTA